MYQINNKKELKKIIEEKKIPLDEIDTSLITDMNSLFKGIREINGSIADWDLSNVINMEKMFYYSSIEPDISIQANEPWRVRKWDTSKVKDMSSIFSGSIFNGDISSWNTSNVKFMYAMFEKSIFNGDISKWNTSSVTDMAGMFCDSLFNRDISIQANEPWRVRKWNVSKVVDMNRMFQCSKFNQDISSWNIKSATDTSYMFSESEFNQDISNWNISKIEYMSYMFEKVNFNHNLGAWDLYNKASKNIFSDSTYTMENYEKDRKEYLIRLRDFEEQKNLKTIDLNQIEFEF